ncbi:hypothetical protein [Anabaena azotica]|uniref:DUF4384 domain-containing protein n=1 Tax=Anabaena azotica FACHB-119 TaxID=947527 RepID=A0ABR8DE74_9NOST|nr:hypothetical protein [Anabaena azotica]MBD2505540.1 hypothetical protein [Anabaena azotica FACHB-119]
MFKWIISCILIVMLIFALTLPFGDGDETVDYNSFGKIKIGMTLAQAKKADPMIAIVQLNGKRNQKDGCFYVQPKSGFQFYRVRFMVVDGKIVTFEINGSNVKTTQNIKVGDSHYNLATYGIKNFQLIGNKNSKQRYFIYTPPKAPNYRMIFESGEYDYIRRYRAGKLPFVNYPFGCANYSKV